MTALSRSLHKWIQGWGPTFGGILFLANPFKSHHCRLPISYLGSLNFYCYNPLHWATRQPPHHHQLVASPHTLGQWFLARNKSSGMFPRSRVMWVRVWWLHKRVIECAVFQVLEVIVMSRYRLTALDTVRNQNFTPFTAMRQKYFYISTSTCLHVHGYAGLGQLWLLN